MESHNPGLLTQAAESKEIIATQSPPLTERILTFLGLSSNKKRKSYAIESASSPSEQQIIRKINASTQTTHQFILEAIHVKTMRIPYDLTDKEKCDLIFEAIDPNEIKTDDAMHIAGLDEDETIHVSKVADKVEIQAHSFVLRGLSKLVATRIAFPSDIDKPPYKFKIPVKHKDNLLQLIKLAYTFDPNEMDALQIDENFIEIIHISSYLQMDELTKVLLRHLEQLLKKSSIADFMTHHNILLAYIVLMSNCKGSVDLEQVKNIFLKHITKFPPSVYKDPSLFMLDEETFSQFLSFANLDQSHKLKLIKNYSERSAEEKINKCQLKLSLIQTIIKLDEIIPESSYTYSYNELVTEMKITDEEVVNILKSLILNYISQPRAPMIYKAWPFSSEIVHSEEADTKMSFDVKIFLEPSKYPAPIRNADTKIYSNVSPPIDTTIDQQTLNFEIRTGISEHYYTEHESSGLAYHKTKCTLSCLIHCDVSNLPFSTYVTGELSASLILADEKSSKYPCVAGSISFFRNIDANAHQRGMTDIPITEDIVHVDSDGTQFAWVHAEVSQLKLQRM